MPVPNTEVPPLITEATDRLAAVRDELIAVAGRLSERDVVLAIATDAVLADDAYAAIESLGTAVERVRTRMVQVRELSQTIDRLADPLLIGEVR